ncbi:MAG: hypothetical protein JNK72_05955 [Myxococcales bacterium]|nr:hypothetical protein [Myxococcales bacterium]
MNARAEGPSIWWWAFGYFAAYVPYAALTKALSSGVFGPRLDGLVVLPLTVLASTVAMAVFLLATGWWHEASRGAEGAQRLPRPRGVTALSGLCTAAILVTTTLAYTFEGVSVVFAMLLMRGGVLLVAPAVDGLSGRRIAARSWVALALTLGSLGVVFWGRRGFALPFAAAVDIGVYLAAYFVRLQVMTRAAKQRDAGQSRRFFVEEQLVASPLSLLALSVWAWAGQGDASSRLREGFSAYWGQTVGWVLILIGVFSQLTGVFGGLILLDRRENSFSVPVNRASSVLAGVVGASVMWALGLARLPGRGEWLGAALLVAALAVLSWPAASAQKA